MSAMSNLAVEIDGMLVEGYLPVTIARLLDVPILIGCMKLRILQKFLST